MLSAFFALVCLGWDGKLKPARPYDPMTPDEIKLHTPAEKRKIAQAGRFSRKIIEWSQSIKPKSRRSGKGDLRFFG